MTDSYTCPPQARATERRWATLRFRWRLMLCIASVAVLWGGSYAREAFIEPAAVSSPVIEIVVTEPAASQESDSPTTTVVTEPTVTETLTPTQTTIERFRQENTAAKERFRESVSR